MFLIRPERGCRGLAELSTMSHGCTRLRVLSWDMVDKSSNSPRTHFKPVFRHWTVQTGHLFPRRGSIRVLLLVP